MAYNVEQIEPIDFLPDVAVGVNLPFTGNAVFNSTYLTKDAIKANLINYFLTNKGERYMNPQFGSNIRKLLFDNIDQEKLEEIKSIVKRDIRKFFPRVNPLLTQVTSDPDNHIVSLLVRYSIVDTNIEDELLINIEI
jgi:phage baseplate assembly protein W